MNNGIFLDVLDLLESKLVKCPFDGATPVTGVDDTITWPIAAYVLDQLKQPKVHRYLVGRCDRQDKRTEYAPTCGFDGRRSRMVGNSLESYLHQDAFGPSR
jgi:hypothetical protein